MNKRLEYLEHLYAALHSESGCGIMLETDDVERLRQKLYPLRKQDPALAVLSFVPDPTTPGRLWIVKRQEVTDGKD